MKVGDYVRTKGGNIIKIETFKSSLLFDYVESKYKELVNKRDIIKTSPNIIDLIEENDLVKIEYYSERYKKRLTRLFEVYYKDEKHINLGNVKCEFMLTDNDFNHRDKELEPVIKSIVTKEQFEEMEYRIGDD